MGFEHVFINVGTMLDLAASQYFLCFIENIAPYDEEIASQDDEYSGLSQLKTLSYLKYL